MRGSLVRPVQRAGQRLVYNPAKRNKARDFRLCFLNTVEGCTVYVLPLSQTQLLHDRGIDAHSKAIQSNKTVFHGGNSPFNRKHTATWKRCQEGIS